MDGALLFVSVVIRPKHLQFVKVGEKVSAWFFGT